LVIFGGLLLAELAFGGGSFLLAGDVGLELLIDESAAGDLGGAEVH
jgi:hypothetical protein